MATIRVLLVYFERGLAPPGHAGGVPQDIDSPQLLYYLCDDFRDAFEVGQVKWHRVRVAAGLAPLLDNLFDSSLVTIKHRHGGASAKQRRHGRASDPGGPSSH